MFAHFAVATALVMVAILVLPSPVCTAEPGGPESTFEFDLPQDLLASGRLVCERKPDRNLIVSGALTYGVTYASVLVAGIALVAAGSGAGNEQYREAGLWFMMPIIGPTAAAYALNEDLAVVGFLGSALQTAGIAILIAGAIGERKCRREFSEACLPDRGRAWALSPLAASRSTGLMLTVGW